MSLDRATLDTIPLVGLTLSIVCSGFAFWVAKQQHRRKWLWAIVSFVIPPIALVIAQNKSAKSYPSLSHRIVGLILCVSIPLTIYYFVDGLRENETFAEVIAPVYSFILTCFGVDVLAQGSSLVGVDTTVEVIRPLTLTMMSSINLGLMAPMMYLVAIGERVLFIFWVMSVGVVGDLVRTSMRVAFFLHHSRADPEPWFHSHSVFGAAQTLIALGLAIRLTLQLSVQKKTANEGGIPPTSTST